MQIGNLIDVNKRAAVKKALAEGRLEKLLERKKKAEQPVPAHKPDPPKEPIRKERPKLSEPLVEGPCPNSGKFDKKKLALSLVKGMAVAAPFFPPFLTPKPNGNNCCNGPVAVKIPEAFKACRIMPKVDLDKKGDKL